MNFIFHIAIQRLSLPCTALTYCFPNLDLTMTLNQ